jgi:arylsulfatase A-like enzyme
MLGSWRSEPATRSASTADAPRRLFFEHMGNCAVREGRWKLVRKYRGPWELYDLATDRTELHDLSVQHPDRVAGMSAAWQKWADRCGVLPRAQVLATSKPNDVTFVKDEFQSSRSVP